MPEVIRLYLDEDVMSRDLVNALRSRAVDLIPAREAGLIHIPDSQHLEYATAQGRTLVTYNTRDYARLHAEYQASDRHHAGIIVSDQVQIGVLVKRLLKLLNTYTIADMQDCLEYLSNWR
jgi:hypothetical protein